jgi:hypothetical protein
MRRWKRYSMIPATAALSLLVAAGPALACGGLIGENGTIELVRTTTLSAYTDGVQRYVTAFEFTGEGAEVGSIVPLPDVPADVVRGGDWTLQRLAREVAPVDQTLFRASAESDDAAADEAEVLFETEIDALDITVLRGGADEVGRWAVEHGFFLSPDAPEMLDFYAARSEIFMAARFDASRAADLGQGAGDSTPIMATIPTDRPWVPLRILSLGAEDSDVIDADVFLLTDDRPQLLAGGRGLALERSEPASAPLLDDLRSDVGMEWVPERMWLTYLQLSAPAGALTYDLAVSTDPNVHPRLEDVGISLASASVPIEPVSGRPGRWPLALALATGLAAVVAVGALRRRPVVGS